jgi:hypothetical protein
MTLIPEKTTLRSKILMKLQFIKTIIIVRTKLTITQTNLIIQLVKKISTVINQEIYLVYTSFKTLLTVLMDIKKHLI